MRWRSATEQIGTPGLEKTISAEDVKRLKDEKDAVATGRGAKVVEDMQNPREWKTWAGKMSVRQMALAAGMSEISYRLGYAWPSQAVHAQDADRYFEISKEGLVRPSLPANPEGALLPATSMVVIGMSVIDGSWGLGKMETIQEFNQRIETLVATVARK